MFCTDPVTGEQYEVADECDPSTDPVGPVAESTPAYLPEPTCDPGVGSAAGGASPPDAGHQTGGETDRPGS